MGGVIETGTGGAVRVNSRRGYWGGRGLAALALATVCAWNIRAGTALGTAMGAVGALVFGCFAVYALRQLLRRGPRLLLSRAGFDAADLGLGLVPWSDVAEVQAFGSPQAPFVAFLVPDAERYLGRMGWYPRTMARWLRASGLPWLSVNLIGVDSDAHEVAALAERYRRAARAS